MVSSHISFVIVVKIDRTKQLSVLLQELFICASGTSLNPFLTEGFVFFKHLTFQMLKLFLPFGVAPFN